MYIKLVKEMKEIRELDYHSIKLKNYKHFSYRRRKSKSWEKQF